MSKSVKITILVILLAVLIIPQIVSAAIVPCGTEANPEKCTLCHVFELAQRVLNGFTIIIFAIAPVFIIIGGLTIIAAGGSPEKVSKGKQMITYAVIGLVITLGAWIIINTTMNALGVKVGTAEGGIPWPWNKIRCGSQGSGNGDGDGEGNGDGDGAPENIWKCIIKNVPGRICPPEGALYYYDPECWATKEVCKSYCEGRANEMPGAEFKECKKYSSPTICQNVEACQGGTGKRWMCIIDVGNAGLAKTGCTSVDQKYLYYSCSATEEVCKSTCDARVKEIDPTGYYGVKFKECRRYSSETECQGYIGCR